MDRPMRTVAAVLASLLALACGPIDQGTAGACGPVEMDGILIPGCVVQSAQQWLDDEPRSDTAPTRCYFEVRLPDSAPADEFAQCDVEPVTATCFVERAGFPLPEQGPSGQGDFPRVKMTGDYEPHRICVAVCKRDEPECVECRTEDIFVPCDVVRID